MEVQSESTELKPDLKHSQVVGGHLVVEDAPSPTWSLSCLFTVWFC